MTIYLYAKNSENLKKLEQFVCEEASLLVGHEKCYSIVENKRAYSELERIEQTSASHDMFIIQSLSELGINQQAINRQLKNIVRLKRILVILDIPSTYKYGIERQLNNAVIETTLHLLTKEGESSKAKAGRKPVPLPENWEADFQKWIKKEITSSEFIQRSKLKKALFYKVLAEYKQQRNGDYKK